MAPSPQKLKEKLLQWRYETAVRCSNDGRVAMFGTTWIMSDDVLDHLVTCAVEGRLQTIQDLQREAHGWPADKKRDLAESFMAAIHAASAPPAPGTSNPSPPNAGDSKSRKRRAPVCAVCNMRGHSSMCTVRIPLRPELIQARNYREQHFVRKASQMDSWDAYRW